ncbi:recombinase family protein [Aquihabitans sp. G128]|nr:recombinase family protein [Aquihabitans sp. G128]QXC59116.1 recombinase family protein [Aquihabitans sp. G128]
MYARISSDDGTALGVARQVEDCHRLAESLGWEVAEDYVDNDVSAYSGKQRPSYRRMLDDIRDGYRDAVIVYHADRLTRRPIELEQFVDVVTDAKVRHVKFVAGGDFDVGNGDGLMVLRMLGAVAANESATKSRRVRRKMDEVAAAGRPHGGANRPFGFEPDKITHRPDEVEVIRRLVARYIAGESLASLTAWLAEAGIVTIAGGPWRTSTLRSLLRNGRIAGLREHRGEVVARAVWEPIISEADRDKVLARMADAATTGRRTPRRYLLSGLLRCSKCGHKLYSSSRATSRRYVCSSSPDHGGCGRLTIVAPPVEELIADAVLYRLDTPELAAALSGRATNDVQSAALSETLAADRAQLDELAAVYAEKAITVREWMEARRPIEARISDTERRLSRLTGSHALTGLIGNGAELRASWAGLNLTRQAAIVAAVLDHAVIAPGTSGARELDAARVDPIWRL